MADAPTFVVVRYGSKGEQLAFHMGHTPARMAKVRKFRKNSRSWTNIVPISPVLVLRPATDKDMKKFGVSRDAKLD